MKKLLIAFVMLISVGSRPLFASQNNVYVQSWADKVSALGYNAPSQTLVNALNSFFDAIDDKMSSIEMIKIYSLNDASLQNASTLNFKNPNLYQSSLVNSPAYGVNGFKSNGTTSYLDGNILINRRSGIEADFYSAAYGVDDDGSVSSNAFMGAIVATSKYLLVRPYQSGGVLEGFGYTGSRTIPASGPKGMSGNVSDSGQSRLFRNSTVTALLAVTSPTLANSIYDCAWNNSGSPSGFRSESYVGLRIEGYEITSVQSEEIRVNFESFLTDIGL